MADDWLDEMLDGNEKDSAMIAMKSGQQMSIMRMLKSLSLMTIETIRKYILLKDYWQVLMVMQQVAALKIF